MRGSIFKTGTNNLWALALIAGLLAGCGDGAQQGGFQPPPPQVTVAMPLATEVTDWDEYTGRFAAVESVDVRSRVSGYLQEVHFTEGSFVKKDDLLFVVDPRPYKAILEEKKADLDRARAQLALAKNELNRARRLYETKAISEEQLDAKTQARSAAQAELEAVQAQLNFAQLDLEFTHITAPISGRIGRALVTDGNLVSGGTENSTLLTTIVSMDPIYFYFTGDEQAYIHYLRLDQEGGRRSSHYAKNPVKLKIADEQEFKHTGHMDFVDNRIDESTGTMLGRAVFNNPDNLFVPGMFGKIQLLGEGPYPALLIPDEAIATDQSRRIVFVVDDKNTVQARLIRIAQRVKGLRVVREGLSATDRIVINGIQRVRPGMEVSPQPGTIQETADTSGSGNAQ